MLLATCIAPSGSLCTPFEACSRRPCSPSTEAETAFTYEPARTSAPETVSQTAEDLILIHIAVAGQRLQMADRKQLDDAVKVNNIASLAVFQTTCRPGSTLPDLLQGL